MPDAPASPVPPPARGRVSTPESLAVAPAVLGRPLAEPWRRLVAMLADLALVGLLSLLAAPWLGLATGAMLVVLFGNAPGVPVALKVVRHICRPLGVLVMVLSALALGHVSLLRSTGLNAEVFTGGTESEALRETVYVAPNAPAAELRDANDRLQRQVDALKAELRAMQAASASWLYQARGFAGALGVTFGWSGVYFTLCAGAFAGRTPGKLLVRIRAVKTNGAPFTFFDAFVRHGGYVAGVAMGLTGFLKLLWDPNRQAVEDRIAGTVVLNDPR